MCIFYDYHLNAAYIGRGMEKACGDAVKNVLSL